MLKQQGQLVNHKRVERVWRVAGLNLPRKRPRRRIPKSAAKPMMAISRANQVWAYDFVFDACANGQKLKLLTVIDEYTRECLAIHVASSITAAGVIAVFEKLFKQRGAPSFIRSDNGPEMIANKLKAYLAQQQVSTLYIEPGSPWQNAKNGSFNGKLRDECLNLEWFYNIREARVIIEKWRRHYNEERLHSSLNYLSPAAFIKAQGISFNNMLP